jgi:hypothetical protein
MVGRGLCISYCGLLGRALIRFGRLDRRGFGRLGRRGFGRLGRRRLVDAWWLGTACLRFGFLCAAFDLSIGRGARLLVSLFRRLLLDNDLTFLGTLLVLVGPLLVYA